MEKNVWQGLKGSKCPAEHWRCAGHFVQQTWTNFRKDWAIESFRIRKHMSHMSIVWHVSAGVRRHMYVSRYMSDNRHVWHVFRCGNSLMFQMTDKIQWFFQYDFFFKFWGFCFQFQRFLWVWEKYCIRTMPRHIKFWYPGKEHCRVKFLEDTGQKIWQNIEPESWHCDCVSVTNEIFSGKFRGILRTFPTLLDTFGGPNLYFF